MLSHMPSRPKTPVNPAKSAGAEPQGGAARAPRIRRSAEDARAAILEATRRRLVEDGPAAIRLTDVADDVGVSHPAILHHFGSRDRLVDAVVERSVESMSRDVLEVIASGVDSPRIVSELFERLASTFGEGGHARVAAFLALARRKTPIVEGVRPLAAALHARRVAHFESRGKTAPPFEDTFFVVTLVAVVLFGDAILGATFRGDQGTPDAGERGVRFRTWFARLVQRHLDDPGPP